jgi:hypothetical protein
MSFFPMGKKHLDRWEAHIIWLLEDQGMYLRNIDMTSILSNEPSKFDIDVMTPSEQQQWLMDPSYRGEIGQRDRIALYTERYTAFKKLPYAKEITSILRAYLAKSIPGMGKGEASYWAVSCLPPPPYIALRPHVVGFIVQSV